MAIEFYKYQGTGNDFVMIDNRHNVFDKNDTKLVANLCDRRFGIGADGLILLENHSSVDFKMVYFNADGNESSMCGNGGRCITAFAKFLGVISDKATFEAIDGMHQSVIKNEIIMLQMKDVEQIEIHQGHLFLNTGSPHHVQLVDDLDALNVKKTGSEIRYGAPYFIEGSNVNFVKKNPDNSFSVRTYERGVEDETLSCGTGVTAVALAMNYVGETNENHVILNSPGGKLEVAFKKNNLTYSDIWLIGPAVLVYKGII